MLAVLGQIRKGRILYHDQAWSDQISLPLWQQTCKWQAVLSNIIFLSQQALHTSLAGGTRRLHTSLSWKSMFTVQNNIKTAYFDRNRKKSINQSNYLHYQCPKKGTLTFTSRPPVIELPKVWTRNCWIGSPCRTKHQAPPVRGSFVHLIFNSKLKIENRCQFLIFQFFSSCLMDKQVS